MADKLKAVESEQEAPRDAPEFNGVLIERTFTGPAGWTVGIGLRGDMRPTELVSVLEKALHLAKQAVAG